MCALLVQQSLLELW